MTLNRTFQLGNLGGDPELFAAKGDKKARATFSLAVNSGHKDKPYWFRFTAFGKLAETCAEHLSKGDRVIVEGRLVSSTYEKDGETRTSVDVVANSVQFLKVAKWNESSQEGGGYYSPRPGDESPF